MRKPSPRTLAALALLLISVGWSLSTYFSYDRAQTALHRADEALGRARQLRKLTDLKLCRAINQGRLINNRDRQTFKDSRRETKAALKKITDPVLHALLVQSLRQNKRELRVRPLLKPISCVAVIQHPTGKLPPGVTTTTSP